MATYQRKNVFKGAHYRFFYSSDTYRGVAWVDQSRVNGPGGKALGWQVTFLCVKNWFGVSNERFKY